METTALARLRAEPVDWRFKGFPPVEPPVTVAEVGAQGWNALAGDFLLPICVLREQALDHNIALMARWCEERGISLAPHGKTPMTPQLVERQLAAGAWGVTVATISQARVYRAFGVQRLLLANELVEPAGIAWVLAELARDADFDFLCLADSVEAVRIMAAAAAGAKRPLRVLVELGFAGGRTGARGPADAVAVADAIVASEGLELAGAEVFEGTIHGPTIEATLSEVDDFLDRLRDLLVALIERGSFEGTQEIVLTAGGSAFFDRVVERLRAVDPRVRLVVRSGCYLAHDSAMYEELSPLAGRAEPGRERLQHALEVWGVVLSRPEPELALVGIGKRDISYDVGLPVPLAVQDASGRRGVQGAFEVTGLNDQHAYLRLPAGDPLGPGDLVGLGISHPCTTFDKWRLIPVVDDDYGVIDAVMTFF